VEVEWELCRTDDMIAAAIHIHRVLGPEPLEKTYEVCLEAEGRGCGSASSSIFDVETLASGSFQRIC
jgi:hypothetical protein